jgi:hypothetical protein
MRIISKFKDYYDCMQKYADYSTTPYNRHSLIKTYKDLDKEELSYLKTDHRDLFIIGFCGKIYGGLSACKKEKGVFKSQICYSYEEYEAFYHNYDLPVNYTREQKRKSKELFFQIENNSLFVKNSAPSFIYLTRRQPYSSSDNPDIICYHTLNKHKKQDSIVQYNDKYESWFPCLFDYSFYNIIPEEQAYMQIESYIKGVLCKEYKQEPFEPNNTKIERAGFDLKASFRKDR